MNRSISNDAGRLKEGVLLISVLIVTAIFFGLLFNRETSLSYSIGYNLYGAQRILSGEIPYRDFHTLYPPATVYLNAAIFKLLGLSLYNALLGVLIFKVLTTVMLYAAGRMIMPRGWAIAAAASSLLWLRPNGPFKAVPMHYGAFFLAATLYLVLRYTRSSRKSYLLAAGIALGVLALFKHNIGAYALAGTLLVVLPASKPVSIKAESVFANYKDALILCLGFILPIIPVVLVVSSQGALDAMTRTLVFGPGDFLLSRLAGWPSPAGFLIFVIALGAASALAYRWGAVEKIAPIASLLLVVASCSIVILPGQGFVDSLIFYAPVGVILWGLIATLREVRRGETQWRVTLAVVAIAASAFLEAFPRFAREQAVASMPFVTLLLIYLLISSYTVIFRLAGGVQGSSAWRSITRVAFIGVLPLTIFLVGARLFISTYFDERIRLKSNTELMTERGRGVFFPAAKAAEIDEVVSYIDRTVTRGGFFFAHSYAGSSYLFLSDRRNPSGAQFWGGVGVTEQERAQTLKALEEMRVGLIITTYRDLRAETYEPMRRYIDRVYRIDRQIGEVIMLARTGETSREGSNSN